MCLKTRYLSLTPGEQCRIGHRAELMSRPTHPVTRQMLSQLFSLSSGATPERSKVISMGRVFRGQTIFPLSVLPLSHRRNALVSDAIFYTTQKMRTCIRMYVHTRTYMYMINRMHTTLCTYMYIFTVCSH